MQATRRICRKFGGAGSPASLKEYVGQRSCRGGRQVMSRASFFALICVLPLATPTLSQHEHYGEENSVGWVPREILQRPVALREGIGKINDPVTTSSAEAQ